MTSSTASAKKVFSAPEICRACGGKCCLRLPGCAAPEDFGATRTAQIEKVKAALRSGDWQLDWWDVWDGMAELPVSKRRVYQPHFIRPRPLDGNTGIFNRTWGGACVFLIPGVGCRLAPKRRPYECRLLEPSAGGNCKADYEGKLTAAELWLDAGIDLQELGNEVQAEREALHDLQMGAAPPA